MTQTDERRARALASRVFLPVIARWHAAPWARCQLVPVTAGDSAGLLVRVRWRVISSPACPPRALAAARRARRRQTRSRRREASVVKMRPSRNRAAGRGPRLHSRRIPLAALPPGDRAGPPRRAAVKRGLGAGRRPRLERVAGAVVDSVAFDHTFTWKLLILFRLAGVYWEDQRQKRKSLFGNELRGMFRITHVG